MSCKSLHRIRFMLPVKFFITDLRRGEEERGGGGGGGGGGTGRKVKRKNLVWQPFVNMFRPSMQSQNTNQSAALSTQQLARKILP